MLMQSLKDIEVKRLQRKKYPGETALTFEIDAVPYFIN